ncbi:hypothetical protein OPT61_g897 [Boeremia exigua]|uniref:Uncharacterized protein n=1 Tax=Boeremia exigua TaxID=749465 RepID=A0ACC2ISH5_9PLEO|nr:hypothetical protein OPT61_g897 [Boeremia exigua]
MLFQTTIIALLASASLVAGAAFPGGDKDKTTCSAVYHTSTKVGETKSTIYETKTKTDTYPSTSTKYITISSGYPYTTTIYKPTASLTVRARIPH